MQLSIVKHRAGLVYRAYLLKPTCSIADIWTFDSNVLVKDNYNRIHPVMKENLRGIDSQHIQRMCT